MEWIKWKNKWNASQLKDAKQGQRQKPNAGQREAGTGSRPRVPATGSRPGAPPGPKSTDSGNLLTN